jgi:hypothetical protein
VQVLLPVTTGLSVVNGTLLLPSLGDHLDRHRERLAQAMES